MSSTPIAASEILAACLESGTEADWTAFVERFRPLVASAITRVLRRHGPANPSLVDDLTQETYLRLCKEDFQVLRDFVAKHDEAIFGFLKVIATSVALDHFRALNTHKRRGEVQEDATNLEAPAPCAPIERSVLISQVEDHLSATQSERDRAILWLHYRQGYSTREIAALPHVELTAKGVEACLYRMVASLRNAFAGDPPQPATGKISRKPLGVIR